MNTFRFTLDITDGAPQVAVTSDTVVYNGFDLQTVYSLREFLGIWPDFPYTPNIVSMSYEPNLLHVQTSDAVTSYPTPAAHPMLKWVEDNKETLYNEAVERRLIEFGVVL